MFDVEQLRWEPPVWIHPTRPTDRGRRPADGTYFDEFDEARRSERPSNEIPAYYAEWPEGLIERVRGD